ncbi:MAG: 3-hydroxyacyl-CoA dehydrogenase NAD-binding domain-containing protein [Gammaproteobacteria bacterium]|nr:3-hydroxyacyl-CoA dehydrogenase NAD-binding domain-containing protein [Gammaproteobacteria bacterium]
MSTSASLALKKQLPVFNNWVLDVSPGGVIWLGLDKHDSSTNVLSRDVLFELEDILSWLEDNPPGGLILHSKKKKGFVLGADINEFPSLSNSEETYEFLMRGHQMLKRLEALPCTSVAMIQGYALGGGLELAMACDVRVVADEDQRTLGLPEVQLGLHPGFGGTVMAVKLAGVLQGMPFMLTGTPVTPRKAKRMGLVDKVCSPDRLKETAVQMALKPPRARKRALLDRILHLDALRPRLASRMRRDVASRASQNHYPAPYAMIDLWEQHAASGESAYRAEGRSFARLIGTETSQNLVRVYFLQEGLKNAASTESLTTPVQHIHVVGAGVMGGDIAAWCALRGMNVTLQDRELSYIEPALKRAKKLFSKRLSDPGNISATNRRLQADVEGKGIGKADLIIEAIFEDRDAKRSLYETIEPQMKQGAVLATNTSSIPLEELSSCLKAPGRFLGIHFFNPVAKMPLVEVVAADSSDSNALSVGRAFTKAIGKLPLPCRSHPGFLVNRILAPYMAEALELVSEGVALTHIDEAAVEFGMPMGPIELIDSVGVDVAQHVAEILSPVVGRHVSPELQKLISKERLGRKNGIGFYQYQDGKPVKPAATESIKTAQIQERLIMSLVNEAAQCLADKVVDTPENIDAGVIFGTGFAPFRGGPLHYAKSCGIEVILDRLAALEGQFGERFRASDGWAELRH